MRKEDAHLLTPGTIVRIGDRFWGRELYGIDNPEEMEGFLGQEVTVKYVQIGHYNKHELIEVYFEEHNQWYVLIEEIEEIVEDRELEEGDMSIEEFLGVGGI